MKKSTIFLAICSVLFVLTSCQGNKNRRVDSGTAAPAGVQHYICANNCAGSGGETAGTCPVCSNPYQHNQAYHNGGNPLTPLTPGAAAPPPVAPATPAPATNNTTTTASSIFHYKCSAGCNSGAAQDGFCNLCSAKLEHNQAYHNR